MSQLKLLEDFIALARTSSFVRAAQQRHVTHPAFGRRIRALESWAGAPLVNHGTVPVSLTPQGESLLKTACQVVEQLDRVRSQISTQCGDTEGCVRIATGRSLARTLVADWIARLRKGRRPVLGPSTQIEIATGMMADMSALLAKGRADLLCCYEHPALSHQLQPGSYQYMTLATDKLVPVCQALRNGEPRFTLPPSGASLPLISYTGGLAMARILGDRLESMPYPLVPAVRCDSLDAAFGAMLNGLGVAWLPWSMVAGDCRRGVLAALGGRNDEIAFEVRLYRPRGRLSGNAEAVWDATARTTSTQ
ncbi:LysR family transcriptional regulator [Pusillimonas sp. TS35]|uniref:LysR family transcriptional regulator n=1 Tax=Paracandidimonas lactea TaxID=2895524 RepID=UPI00136B9E55|nr:LysR family transcriptional regulator [Paracandidimonas lactea]MYN12843.1 LysR family transcriptional regulator [Pusillimonas sp. TS35]